MVLAALYFLALATTSVTSLGVSGGGDISNWDNVLSGSDLLNSNGEESNKAENTIEDTNVRNIDYDMDLENDSDAEGYESSAEKRFSLTAPSLGKRFSLTAPSLGKRFNLVAPSLGKRLRHSLVSPAFGKRDYDEYDFDALDSELEGVPLDENKRYSLVAPSLGKRYNFMAPSLGKKYSGMVAAALGKRFSLTAPSLGKRFSLTAPSLGKRFSLTAPSLGKRFMLTAPSLGKRFSLTAPSLGKRFMLTAPSLGKRFSLTAPSLGKRFSLTAPSLGKRFRLTAPSLGKKAFGLTAPALGKKDGEDEMDDISDELARHKRNADTFGKTHNSATVKRSSSNWAVRKAMTMRWPLRGQHLFRSGAFGKRASAQH